MVSYLAFDNRSIKFLLADENQEYFNDEFPVFFKHSDGKSPIDVALERNHVRSVNLMTTYIIKYQNNYISA